MAARLFWEQDLVRSIRRGRMVRHCASNAATRVRFSVLALCRRSRLVRRHVANVNQAGSIPVSCSGPVRFQER
jgi:hypothetical protein